jgi:dTMP kinase
VIPKFVVLEGLSGVGKSTTAPLLAARLDAVLVTLPPHLAELRVRLDSAGLMARLHFWMMCNYTVSEQVQVCLAAGRSVVVESYFYRTLATHAAMGVDPLPPVDWNHALVPDLAVLLRVDESERQRRLACREWRSWARLEESHVDVTRGTYESFGLISVDTDGLNPNEVTAVIARQLRRRSEASCSIR